MEWALLVLAFAVLKGRSSSSGSEAGVQAGADAGSQTGSVATPDSTVPWGGIIGTGLSTAGTIAGAVISAAAAGGGGAAAAGASAAAGGAGGAAAAGAAGGGAATAAGTGGGSAAGASAAVAAGASAWATAGWAALIIAIEATVALIISLIGTFASEVSREWGRRAQYGVRGLNETVRKIVDEFAGEGIVRIGQATGQYVSQGWAESILPAEVPSAGTVADARLGLRGALLGAVAEGAGRAEIVGPGYFVSDASKLGDQNTLRDVYRAMQALGLKMVETDNLIRWSYFRAATPAESEAAAELRLQGAGLALSPAGFRGAVVEYWLGRQWTPWRTPAPIDASSGTDQAGRGIAYLFGGRAAEYEARIRLQGAASAWTWLQKFADLLSRPAAYRAAFRAAGLVEVQTDVWQFPAAPGVVMSNGKVIDLNLVVPTP